MYILPQFKKYSIGNIGIILQKLQGGHFVNYINVKTKTKAKIKTKTSKVKALSQNSRWQYSPFLGESQFAVGENEIFTKKKVAVRDGEGMRVWSLSFSGG